MCQLTALGKIKIAHSSMPRSSTWRQVASVLCCSLIATIRDASCQGQLLAVSTNITSKEEDAPIGIHIIKCVNIRLVTYTQVYLLQSAAQDKHRSPVGGDGDVGRKTIIVLLYNRSTSIGNTVVSSYYHSKRHPTTDGLCTTADATIAVSRVSSSPVSSSPAQDRIQRR